MCVIAVVGVAPCQCRSLGGHQITSPGPPSTFSWPSLRNQPQPAVTMSVCPSGCQCHAVCAPGSNVTLAPRTRAGSGASNNGSIRTVPVKYSSGPLAEGCVPFLLNSMMNLQAIAILLWSSRAVANNPGSTSLDITQHWKEQILAAQCLSLVTEGCVIPAKTEPSFWDKNGGGRSAENESTKSLAIQAKTGPATD